MEKEQELKLGAEERSAALQQRVSLDIEVIACLCKERDKLRQTMERLCLEHGAARGERDPEVVARLLIGGRDAVQQALDRLADASRRAIEAEEAKRRGGA